MTCRLCGKTLKDGARAIGVCAWCIKESYTKLTIPSPRYGGANAGDDDADPAP